MSYDDKNKEHPHAMTLTEQLMGMAENGAVLNLCNGDRIWSLGLLRVDEAAKCLFFMRRWAQGTGDAHVFRWGSYDRNAIFVNFYRAKDGELKGVIGPHGRIPRDRSGQGTGLSVTIV